ncbi:hypothetical protein ACFL7D_00325 [candidate division KSB1 bacterium]
MNSAGLKIYFCCCWFLFTLLISVYSCKKSPTEPVNSKSVIRSISADPSYLDYLYSDTSAYSLITVSAYDPDGDKLTFSFSASKGEIRDVSDSTAKYFPEEFTGMAEVTCSVSDGELTIEDEVGIFVNYKENIPPRIKGYFRHPHNTFIDEFGVVNPVVLEVIAEDSNNDKLTFTFEAEQGILSEQDSNTVEYTAPAGVGDYLINCIVTD